MRAGQGLRHSQRRERIKPLPDVPRPHDENLERWRTEVGPRQHSRGGWVQLDNPSVLLRQACSSETVIRKAPVGEEKAGCSDGLVGRDLGKLEEG